jgi:hypothetical protein
MLNWLRSEPQSVVFERDVRRHLTQRLHVNEYMVSREMDNLLKQQCAFGLRIKQSTVDVSISFATDLLSYFRASEEIDEKNAGRNLYIALMTEIPIAALCKDLSPGIESTCLAEINSG